MTDYESLWTSVASEFRLTIGDAAWKTWFSTLSLQKCDGNTITLTTTSPLARERLVERYLGTLNEIFASVTSEPPAIRVVVRAQVPEIEPPTSSPKTQVLPLPPRAPSVSSTLDPRYTFDAFVIGSSNRFAHAAALSVAETPSQSYNPLFIHGDAGLGKTHLLHAIGNYIAENYPSQNIRYLSTETFLNDFVDSIKRNKTSEFKARYRACDVLLMDDIQFLENKEGTQEEFFHTFNFLYGAHKQIVLTSDRPPRAIATLEDRLRSRFAMGLITDVQPPDLETRQAILRRKAETLHMTLPDSVVSFIAENVRDNIRELEGALNRVRAYGILNGTKITLEDVETTLSDFVSSRTNERSFSPAEIIYATAAFFDLTAEDLLGHSRKRPIATARQIAMYVVRELTELSYPAIGRAFGGKDHTTVMHSVEKVQSSMSTSVEVFQQVDQLFKTLRAPRSAQ